jgi:hypothetical protein
MIGALGLFQSPLSVSWALLSRPRQPMASVAIATGLIWGVTNPFIARGVRIAGALPVRSYTGELGWWRAGAPGVRSASRRRRHSLPTPTLPRFHVPAGLAWLDGLLHHLLTPAFIVPQALNLCGSVLFAATLGSTNISLAAPVANGAAGTLCVSPSAYTT